MWKDFGVESCPLFEILHQFQFESWGLNYYLNPTIALCKSEMFFLSFTHIDVFSQTKWKISQNPFSLHSAPGVSKIPSLWVNDRFSGNNLVQGKSLTRLFVKMSNLSVSGRIRHSSLGKYLQSLSDVDHTLIHSFESQKYLADILLIRCKVDKDIRLNANMVLFGSLHFHC